MRYVLVLLIGLLLLGAFLASGHFMVWPLWLLALPPVFYGVRAGADKLRQQLHDKDAYSPRWVAWLLTGGCLLAASGMSLEHWGFHWRTADALNQLLGFVGGAAVGCAILLVLLPTLFDKHCRY